MTTKEKELPEGVKERLLDGERIIEISPTVVKTEYEPQNIRIRVVVESSFITERMRKYKTWRRSLYPTYRAEITYFNDTCVLRDKDLSRLVRKISRFLSLLIA